MFPTKRKVAGMTRYTDYNFYEGQYGGTLTQEQFQKVILPVSAYLRRFTFGRADSGMEEVQYAACACCDLLHRERSTVSQYGGRRVASENTDGYAVSYVPGTGCRNDRGRGPVKETLPGSGFVSGANRAFGFGGVYRC